MSSTPTECREQAKHCLELAAHASPLARPQFQQFAQIWARLAVDTERSKALLERWGAAKLRKTG